MRLILILNKNLMILKMKGKAQAMQLTHSGVIPDLKLLKHQKAVLADDGGDISADRLLDSAAD